MDFDEALEHAGKWGRYQTRLYALIFISGIPNAFTALLFVISHYEPNHHCKLPDILMNFSTNISGHYEVILNYTIPLEVDHQGEEHRSQCLMYNRNYSAFSVDDLMENGNQSVDTIPCTNGWIFDTISGQASAVTDFGMVCENAWKVPLAATVYIIGKVIGALCVSLADRFGRRPLFLWGCFMQAVSLLMSGLSWEYYLYTISGIIGGISTYINFCLAFIVGTEVSGVEWRNFMAIGGFYSYAVGYTLFAPLAYIFPNWRSFLYAASSFTAITYIPSYWLFPESARWLLAKGKIEEAKEELKRIARINQNEVDFENLIFKDESTINKHKKKNDKPIRPMQALWILYGPGIRWRCLAVNFLGMVSCLGYYIIAWYSTTFSSDRILNILYSALSEFPAYIAVYYFVRWMGTPRTTALLSLICVVSSVSLAFIPGDFAVALTVTSVVGKIAISAAFYIAYLLASEVSPTTERSAMLSISTGFARLGALLAPILMYIGKEQPAMPNLVIGGLSFLSGVAAIMLIPETAGVPMPDTLKDAENNKRYYGLNVCKQFKENTRV